MQNLAYIILGSGAVFCAYRAMVARRILSATLYLACVSAAVAGILYYLGVFQVAVIELSVGAGLVTVMLVYALSVVGDDAHDLTSVISKPLALAFVGACTFMLVIMVAPGAGGFGGDAADPLSVVLWQKRVIDVWIQIALIFCGVLGVLGLLSEQSPSHEGGHAPAGEKSL